MKHLVTIAAIALTGILVSFKVLTSSIWVSDSVHSRLGFTVTHLGVSDMNGSFDTYEVKFTANKEDLSDAKLELTGDAASINTGNEARDNHLKTADFFDAEKYPKFTFVSKSFKKAKGGEYTVVGDLTLHGITKPVTLTAKKSGVVTHPMSKKEVTGFKVTGSFKRSDFGIGASIPEAMLSDEVKLISDLEMGKE